MIYFLHPDFGANVQWECKYISIVEDKMSTYENPTLLFDLLMSEGNTNPKAEVPDLLIWKEPAFIPNIVDRKADFFLASDELVDVLTCFHGMPYNRYRIAFNDDSSLSLKNYSLIVFLDKLSNITVYPETSIQVSSLSNPAEGEVIKGYCQNLTDFNTKMQTLISTEMKMIQFKEYAVVGELNLFGLGKNTAIISERINRQVDFSRFSGIKVMEITRFNIKSLPDAKLYTPPLT